MPKLKPETTIPTHEEDSRIDVQIKSDPDDLEWTDEMFSEAKSFEDSDLPETFKSAVRRGRPKAENPKILLTVRYSREVVEFFKATGKGWQTRMDEVLRKYVAAQR